VSTYIQSGNLVLSTDRGAAAVARELGAALATRVSTDVAVVVRTRRQLEQVVARNPYLGRGEDPAHLHVLFVAGAAAPALAPLDVPSYAPEDAIAIGSELFLLLPGGVGRSKLATDLGRQTGVVGTMRSWRTVTKLLALAERAQG